LPAAEDSYHPHIGSFTNTLLQPSVHSSTFFALSNYQLDLGVQIDTTIKKFIPKKVLYG